MQSLVGHVPRPSTAALSSKAAFSEAEGNDLNLGFCGPGFTATATNYDGV